MFVRIPPITGKVPAEIVRQEYPPTYIADACVLCVCVEEEGERKDDGPMAALASQAFKSKKEEGILLYFPGFSAHLNS